MSKKQNIIFTDTVGIYKDFFPKPASNFIPNWYKKTPSYMTGKKIPNPDGSTPSTIKRCMPVFDAINVGYIIPTYVDLYVSREEGVVTFLDETKEQIKLNAPKYDTPEYKFIEMHMHAQAEFYPRGTEYIPYPKFINPWSIQTPPGTSCLFVTPSHHDLPFTILPGIVDTDMYHTQVNFPFVLNDINFEGIIPAGTPMVQVVPFRRDPWEMSFGNYKDIDQLKTGGTMLRKLFFDTYKNFFRQPKEYR